MTDLADQLITAAAAIREYEQRAAHVVISFELLRNANRARHGEWWTGDGAQALSLSFRAAEFAGKAGEVCNVVKKLERERMGIKGSRATLRDLADELADAVICADLIAMDAGINLAEAVVRKFNATSEKVGLQTRMTETVHTFSTVDAAERSADLDGENQRLIAQLHEARAQRDAGIEALQHLRDIISPLFNVSAPADVDLVDIARALAKDFATQQRLFGEALHEVEEHKARGASAYEEAKIYLANQIQREASCAKLREALGLALSVADDCHQRWSRGHPDRVAKARAAYDTIRGDGTILTPPAPGIPPTQSTATTGDVAVAAPPEAGAPPSVEADDAPASGTFVETLRLVLAKRAPQWEVNLHSAGYVFVASGDRMRHFAVAADFIREIIDEDSFGPGAHRHCTLATRAEVLVDMLLESAPDSGRAAGVAGPSADSGDRAPPEERPSTTEGEGETHDAPRGQNASPSPSPPTPDRGWFVTRVNSAPKRHRVFWNRLADRWVPHDDRTVGISRFATREEAESAKPNKSGVVAACDLQALLEEDAAYVAKSKRPPNQPETEPTTAAPAAQQEPAP